MVRVLVGCEFSGAVRDAFRARGHDAVSCDMLPSESADADAPHVQGDLLREIGENGASYDMMIAFPPCTHLAVSGARWFAEKRAEQAAALDFFRRLLECGIPRICLENPVSIVSSRIKKPAQIIQPWMFGHGETKATCLWLRNLPPLRPTNVVDGREHRVANEPPGPDRWKRRSRTFDGIANAMADQWGTLAAEGGPLDSWS